MQGGSLTPSREAAGHSGVLQLLETVEEDLDTHTWRQPPAGSPQGLRLAVAASGGRRERAARQPTPPARSSPSAAGHGRVAISRLLR